MAEHYLREAIAINDGDYRPKLELSIVLAKKPGSEREAKGLLMEALRWEPENRRAYSALKNLSKQKARKNTGRKRRR